MPIDIVARRSLDAKAVLANLKDELTRWSLAAQNQLPTHRSQILAAHDTLDVLLKRLEDDPPSRSEPFTQMVLSAHRVWDFYRTKFEQRTNAELKAFLDIADQLAYDCFKPVADHLKRVPPLVVLNGASVPYIQERESPFSVEGVATPDGLHPLAVQATAKLPFPVVGLPWSQLAQLAGLTVIAHEIGHAVEDDARCTPTLQGVFGATPARSDDWKRWQRELFADMWGCLCCGPAFAFALANHLAPSTPWREPITAQSTYPPAWLRIRFAFQLLWRLSGPERYPGEVESRCREWETLYPFDAELRPYLDDIPEIADRLVAAALPGLGEPRRLELRFTAEDYAESANLASRWSPTPPAGPPQRASRMRVEVAAFRLAYESDPNHVATNVKAASVMKTLTAAVQTGFRSASPDYQAENRLRAADLYDLLAASWT